MSPATATPPAPVPVVAPPVAGRTSSPPPWYLVLPPLLCGLGVAIPLGYLAMRAFAADPGELAELLLRWRNVSLLANTLLLTVAVLAVTVALALPAAWLTVRADLPARGFFTLALVMPLAVPGYLMAYTLLAIGGNYGALAQLTGITAPRLSGFVGALVALSLYNFPYMLLNLRAGLITLDPAMEESARGLGLRPVAVFYRVVLPHLRPALLAGSLIVGLHVITDFGVVSLMGYETFSYALYAQYTAGMNPVYGAWIALMLLALAAAFIAIEIALLRGLRLHRTGATTTRRQRTVALGAWKAPALALLTLILLAAVAVPVATMSYWASRADLAALAPRLGSAVVDSLAVSIPAAVTATLLAMPVAFLARRYPSKRSLALERVSYLGYATPSLAFALALVVAGVYLPDGAYRWLYQELPVVLVYAYSLHFLAEAVGPVRAGLYQATPKLEEASRSLGHSQIATFVRVTLPLLRSGLVVAMALVFLSAMKELPLTFLLSPLGFDTLATNIWSHTREAMYAEAAPFALLIMLVSAAFVAVLLSHERHEA